MVILIYEASDGSKRSLDLDAALSQSHSKTVEVTKFPVESGATVSDHAIRRPDTYRLEGIVTNTPIVKKEDMESGKYERRAESAREVLESLLEARNAITIDTGAKVFEMMVMASLELPRDAAVGDCTKFSATFEKISTVSSETVALPKSPKPGIARGGKKPTTKAAEPVKRKVSVLKQLVDKMRGAAPVP